jgi:CzcA family heavy metal efflux pump
MRWIIGLSLRFRHIVVGLAAVLLFFGAGQIGHEKLDVFPEFAPTLVQIQTACLGLSASEVEELVSVPLEDALDGVKGVETIRSESVPQLSSITLVFKRGTDLLTARQLVQERLQTVTPTLPTWAAPPFLMQPVSATSRIMSVGLSSRTISPMDLSMIAYWKIRARLLRVPGIANVAIWGEQLKQVQVQVKPKQMQTERVSLDSVMRVTSNALDSGLLRYTSGTTIGTGGFVEYAKQRLPVQDVLPIATPAQLAQVPVTERGNRTLRIGDVARVLFGPQPPIGDAVVNGHPGLLLVIEKFPGANTLDVTNGVDRALAELRPGLPGVQIDANIFRPAGFIKTAIHNLSLAVLLGCLLVGLVLVAFLSEWRAGLISLIAIPLSLIAAAIVLDLAGVTLNTMMLAGFAVSVGVVVDDAIIDMENIMRRLRGRRAEGRPLQIASVILDASLEVRTAIVFATLIDVVTVIPVILIGGLSGAFFRPLILGYALAVLASMLVALTVTPALALILLRGAPLDRREPPLARLCKRGYDRALSRLIATPWPAFAAMAVLTTAGLILALGLGSDLFPTFKERDFLSHWVTPPGTSINEERRMVNRVSNELRTVPGVRDFGSHIGQAFLGEEIAGPNFGENWISVDPRADYHRTLASIQQIADQTPGMYRDVQTYLRERIDEVLAGTTSPIVIRIFGPGLGALHDEADRVKSLIANVPGLKDLHTDQQQDVPQIDVQVKLPVAQRYGIKPGDVRRAASTLLAGEETGDIYRGGKAYDVAVWSTPSTRRSLNDVRALPIDTPNGGPVSLGTVASVRIVPTPNVIRRDNASRKIDVDANLAGRDLGSVTRDIKQRLEHLRLPLGYRAELMGEAVERQSAQSQLLLYAGGIAIAILLLLQTAFASLRLASLLFVTLPIALVGGVVAAWTSGGVISLGALVGFYTVWGIAARNGIMMISHLQHLERHEGEPFGPGLVIRGARERLSPILMTALATGLALLPLAFADKPGQEIEHPMAIVILGGLVTSTLLNLFIMPIVYLRVGRRRAH